jgi:uncharacterized damage-inducible protein DinB
VTREGDVLADAFGRIRETVEQVLDGLDPDDLAFRPGGTGNSIAWLVWHLARVQDDHIADASAGDQVWPAFERAFALPFDSDATGYGMSSDEVELVRGFSASQLVDYLGAVTDRTLEYLGTLSGDDLDRIVDTRWTPPVTLAARLVSVIADDLQHAGQAGYVRGLLPGR